MENAKKLASYHVLFHHHEADGWITVARKEGKKWIQKHYKPDKLALKLSEWLGEDVYFSQNTFYKPYRKIENIRQLRAMYVDLDFYILNYDGNWVLGNIDLMVDDGIIPNPNMVIHSGRGVVCVWLIEPAPYKALPLWQVLQEYFLKELEKYGADGKAIDAARVFRLAGSVNSKSGEVVKVDYRHQYRYSLRELKQEYLPELPDYDSKNNVKKKGRPTKVAQLFNTYRLHVTRLRDLVKLCELRQYDVEGHRELILFLYRYWSCCVLNDGEEALEATKELNSQFKKPLPLKEVVSATKSAEKAWAARSSKEANELAIKKGYPGAGYNVSNKKIISWLDISTEEQKYLETIIDGSEKKRRKKLANRELRGSVSREEYLEEQQERTEDKLWQLQKAIERYPTATNVKLAELLAVSEGYIRKLKKKL